MTLGASVILTSELSSARQVASGGPPNGTRLRTEDQEDCAEQEYVFVISLPGSLVEGL